MCCGRLQHNNWHTHQTTLLDLFVGALGHPPVGRCRSAARPAGRRPVSGRPVVVGLRLAVGRSIRRPIGRWSAAPAVARSVVHPVVGRSAGRPHLQTCLASAHVYAAKCKGDDHKVVLERVRELNNATAAKSDPPADDARLGCLASSTCEVLGRREFCGEAANPTIDDGVGGRGLPARHACRLCAWRVRRICMGAPGASLRGSRPPPTNSGGLGRVAAHRLTPPVSTLSGPGFGSELEPASLIQSARPGSADWESPGCCMTPYGATAFKDGPAGGTHQGIFGGSSAPFLGPTVPGFPATRRHFRHNTAPPGAPTGIRTQDLVFTSPTV